MLGLACELVNLEFVICDLCFGACCRIFNLDFLIKFKLLVNYTIGLSRLYDFLYLIQV